MIYLGELVQLANKYYSESKFKHAGRVATYAMEEALKTQEIAPEEAYAVGLAHDLLEDTECTADELLEVMSDDLIDDVIMLTKGNIENGSELAKLVKEADIKDHLSQKVVEND